MDIKSCIKSSLIAACGMNCGVCVNHLGGKCPGCNENSSSKCAIRNCEIIKNSKLGLCYECEVGPCTKLLEKDEKYKTKYGTSVIENLDNIKEFGLDNFILAERIKWACSKCKGVICIQTGCCHQCGESRK